MWREPSRDAQKRLVRGPVAHRDPYALTADVQHSDAGPLPPSGELVDFGPSRNHTKLP